MPGLVVIAPGPVHVHGGRLTAPVKFVEGVQAYVDRFPGDVVLAARPAAEPDADNLGVGQHLLDDLGFSVLVSADLEADLRTTRPDVALAPLTAAAPVWMRIARRHVLVAEHTGRSRLAMALATQRPGLVSRTRMELGFRRSDLELRRIARAADGLQCNGAVAWDAYSRRTRLPLRVYDNRVRSTMIDEAAGRRLAPLAGRLRLGFSGRLIPIKGPEFAVALVPLLQQAGVEVSLDVFGDGPQRAELAAQGPDVRFRGELDFAGEWCRAVAEGIDLMVLPHVQPDPSGTYLEAAGMGVPVLGFDNRALESLVTEAGIGWKVPMRDLGALAATAVGLAAAPERLVEAGAAAAAFMREHCFERDFDRRVEHLLHVMG